jgi:Kef-type K+ transport system membrane component KefB
VTAPTVLIAVSPTELVREPLGEIALALLIAALGGSLFAWARQPTLPAYLLAGVVAGPAGLGLIGKTEAMSVLAQIGVLAMLFLVGVKLDLRILSRVGPAAIAGAVIQIVVIGSAGFGLAIALGSSALESAYVGSAAAISSTVIVVTLLGQQKELDSLHGKLSIAILIVQDIFAVVALFILPSLGGGKDASNSLAALGGSILRVTIFVVLAIAAYFVFRPLSAMASRSAETSYVFLIAWMLAVGLAGVALGMGKEAGAFTAGVMISTARHGQIAASRLAGVRDFMVPLFFLSLGSQVSFGGIGRVLSLALGLVVLVLVVKPVVLFIVLTRARFGARSAALSAISMGQASEFSLLLLAAGATAHQLGEDVQSAILFSSFVSFVVSSFLSSYAPRIFRRSESLLVRFERQGGEFELATEAESAGKFPSAPVVIFGAGRIGGRIIEELQRHGIDYLAFDFDPVVVKSLRKVDRRVYFGDAEDPDLMDYVDLDSVRIVVSTVRNQAMSNTLIGSLRSRGYAGKIVVTADDDDEQARHIDTGADLVLVPYLDAAEVATAAVCEVLELRPSPVLSEEDPGKTRSSDSDRS